MCVQVDESGEADDDADRHRDAERESIAARMLFEPFRQPSISYGVPISCHVLSILHRDRVDKMTGHHTRYTNARSMCAACAYLFRDEEKCGAHGGHETY